VNGRIRLEYQADCIEATLASHRVRSRVAGGTVTPRFVRFDLLPAPGTRIKRISALAEELALALNAPACRVYRRGGCVQVEVPRDRPSVVRFARVCARLDDVPPCCALLGLDEEGLPVLLRLPSADVAHVLIAGNTGSGKTVLARTMALSLARYNPPRRLQLTLIDPKRRGFGLLSPLPHLLTPLIHRPERAAVVLARLVAEMERRDLRAGTGYGECAPRVVVLIDELADLMMAGGREIERPLTRLAQRGREAGIHLVACTQRPAASVIGGLIKSNFPVRIVGSVASAEDAKMAAGLPRTGAERLLGKGDFLVVARGQQFRVQGAYASPSEMRRLVRELVQAKRARTYRAASAPRAESGTSLSALGQRVAQATRLLFHRLPALWPLPALLEPQYSG
jgi:S-DNA-T family DNA segregation ATPase FtsK/SpoIIIE